MKKTLVLVFLLGLAVIAYAGTTPLLVESYQDGTINIPGNVFDTVTIIEVGFSVDSACYIQIAAGGQAERSHIWFEIDGVIQPPEAFIVYNPYYFEETFTLIYTYLLEPGEHTISLRFTHYYNDLDETALSINSYLQALIFLPDEPSAVAERPAVEPVDGVSSLITSGPYVNVAGASQLVDASGRIMENAITEERVYVNNLPTGTYFARDEENTVVKIVKVQ